MAIRGQLGTVMHRMKCVETAADAPFSAERKPSSVETQDGEPPHHSLTHLSNAIAQCSFPALAPIGAHSATRFGQKLPPHHSEHAAWSPAKATATNDTHTSVPEKACATRVLEASSEKNAYPTCAASVPLFATART